MVRLTLGFAALAICLSVPAAASALPSGFFGIAPQTAVAEADARYMTAGGIESIRVPVSWPAVQPTPTSPYIWTALDETVAVAARAHLQVLPFFVGTPSWLEHRETTLPVSDAAEKGGWSAFVTAAVSRYGPHGAFWVEHGPYSSAPVPEYPIRGWQVWNEANFLYFAYPVSPARYAALLKLTAPIVKSIDPGARVILSGLFGSPDDLGSRGMSAASFLDKLYQVPGISADFDGVALHPYAFDQKLLKAIVGEIHGVIVANRDHAALYITEIGWGSQNDPKEVAFEKGPAGQARELRNTYRYLIANQRRLRLRGVYWFSWKDIAGACDFCDSVGLFDSGPGFTPKPAWSSFVRLSGGRPHP